MSMLNVFKRDIMVFTDGGLDDLVAIRELINSTTGVNRTIHLVPCDGNVPYNIVIVNLCKTIDITHDKDVIIYSVLDTDVIDTSIEICSDWVGTDGLGNLSSNLVDTYDYSAIQSVSCEDLTQMIAKSKLLDIIILSPMAVPFKVLNRLHRDDIVGKESKIGVYIMGGCEVEGNFNEDMEFNQGIEPVSFAKCMTMLDVMYHMNSINLNIMTLERCMHAELNMNNYKEEFKGDDIQIQLLDANYKLMCDRNSKLGDGETPEDLYIFDLYIVQKYLWDLGVMQKVAFEKVTAPIKGLIEECPNVVSVR